MHHPLLITFLRYIDLTLTSFSDKKSKAAASTPKGLRILHFSIYRIIKNIVSKLLYIPHSRVNKERKNTSNYDDECPIYVLFLMLGFPALKNKNRFPFLKSCVSFFVQS
jgi:hypothetical protein